MSAQINKRPAANLSVRVVATFGLLVEVALSRLHCRARPLYGVVAASAVEERAEIPAGTALTHIEEEIFFLRLARLENIFELVRLFCGNYRTVVIHKEAVVRRIGIAVVMVLAAFDNLARFERACNVFRPDLFCNRIA